MGATLPRTATPNGRRAGAVEGNCPRVHHDISQANLGKSSEEPQLMEQTTPIIEQDKTKVVLWPPWST